MWASNFGTDSDRDCIQMFLNLVQSHLATKTITWLIKFCDWRPLWLQQTKKTILQSFNRLTIRLNSLLTLGASEIYEKQTHFIMLVQKVDRGMLIPHAYLSWSCKYLCTKQNPEPSACCCPFSIIKLSRDRTCRCLSTNKSDLLPKIRSGKSCWP